MYVLTFLIIANNFGIITATLLKNAILGIWTTIFVQNRSNLQWCCQLACMQQCWAEDKTWSKFNVFFAQMQSFTLRAVALSVTVPSLRPKLKALSRRRLMLFFCWSLRTMRVERRRNFIFHPERCVKVFKNHIKHIFEGKKSFTMTIVSIFENMLNNNACGLKISFFFFFNSVEKICK